MDFYLVGQRQHLRLLLEQGPVLRLKVGLDLRQALLQFINFCLGGGLCLTLL